MEKYCKESGLSEYEWKLEKIVDMIRNERCTLLAIKKLEREIEQLNVDVRKDFENKNCVDNKNPESCTIRHCGVECKECSKYIL